MNVRRILSISALTVLGMVLVPSNAVSQQKSLKDQIVGAWMVMSQELTAPDGTKRQGPGGPNPRGVLILDASGQYAFVVERPDRPKFKTGPGKARSDGTAEEFIAAVRTFAAEFGTWSVNEADKTLIRRYEGALIPNNEGAEAKETVSLAGDELKLISNAAAGGRVDVLRRAK